MVDEDYINLPLAQRLEIIAQNLSNRTSQIENNLIEISISLTEALKEIRDSAHYLE